MSVLSAGRAVAPLNTTVPSLRRVARTTPGVVVLVALAVVVCCAVAAAVCVADLNHRIAEHNTVLQRSEPFAYAAQNLYAALSEADAAAASAFLSGGIQTPAMRERYQQAVAAAASALTDVTAGATDEDVRTAVAGIAAQLATYTGLVEAARANNLQGFPVGSAYLREASSLMQNELLPGAEQILARDLAAVDTGQRNVASVSTVSIVLLSLLLIGTAVGSWILARRTNRQFNLGLVVAAVCVLIAITWIGVATRLAAADIERSRTEGTARFAQLANARILAQQARTDETLQLIGRGDITAGEKSFQATSTNCCSRLQAGAGRRRGGHPEMDRQPPQAGGGLSGRRLPGRGQRRRSDQIPSASAAQFARRRGEPARRDRADPGHAARRTCRRRRATTGVEPTGTLVLMALGAWPQCSDCGRGSRSFCERPHRRGAARRTSPS